MPSTKRPLINPHRVDLTSLRILLAVAQTGSITQAAEQCPPALGAASTRIKELEQRLGVELLELHARGVRLTEAGRHFVERIAVGIDQLDHAVKTALNDTTAWGRLREGAESYAKALANDIRR